MTKQSQYFLLIDTLKHIEDQAFSVTSIRDRIVKEHPTLNLDPAALRRYIYGKFKIFLKKGLLEKISTPEKNKQQYRLRQTFSELTEKTSERQSPGPLPDNKSFELLTSKVYACRREIAIQIGEIKEYQQLIKDIPHLETKLEIKLEETTRDNYRLLGCLRAIENSLLLIS